MLVDYGLSVGCSRADGMLSDLPHQVRELLSWLTEVGYTCFWQSGRRPKAPSPAATTGTPGTTLRHHTGDGREPNLGRAIPMAVAQQEGRLVHVRDVLACNWTFATRHAGAFGNAVCAHAPPIVAALQALAAR